MKLNFKIINLMMEESVMKGQGLRCLYYLMLMGLFIGLSLKSSAQKNDKDTTSIFELSLEQLLNTDVTTASKSAEKQSDAPGIISVITRDELERFGGTTLKDVLERVPGISTGSANYTNRTIINIGGDQIKNNSSHVLILINGRPVREVQEGGVSSEIIETFPVNIIEKIEVIKGPGSVLYGSDAFSGVINIITKRAEKSISASASGIAGNGSAAGMNGDISVKAGDFSLVVAGRYLKKKVWDVPYKTTYYASAPPPFFFVQKDTLLMKEVPNKGGGLFANISYKGFSYQTSYNQWTTTFFQGLTEGNNKSTKNFNNLGYSLKVNDNWTTDINITYTKSNIESVISKRSCYNMVAELTNSINLSKKTKLIIGGLFNKNDGEETMVTTVTQKDTAISKGTINSFAFYTQLDYHLLESVKLIGGLQAIKVENIKFIALPRLGVIWYPAERLSVKGLYSKAFRAPSINETNMNYQGLLLGDKNLKPEKVSTFDVGIGYQGEKAQIGFHFFTSKMTDIVVITGSFFLQQYSNATEVTFNGGELEAKYYLNKNLFFQGSMLYQTSKDSLSNASPLPNFGSKAGVSFKSDNGGVIISLFDIYQDGLAYRWSQAKMNPHGAYNLMHLHTNFNLNKLFNLTFKPDISLFINVDNLFDKKIYIHDFQSNDYIPYNFGRGIYFGLNATF